MAVHKAPNCLIQLLLLVWKNFSMLLGRKCYMISLLVFFAILPLLLMSLRLIPPLRSKPQINEPIPTIGLLSTMPLNIYFAPKTQLLESLVKEINGSKITAFENSQELQKALIDFSDEKSKVIGIEFAESWTEWPDKLSFALRAPERSASDTNDKFSMSGSTSYYGNGFLAVQLALSKAHINHKCKELECPKEIKFPEFRDIPSPPIFQSDYTGSLHGLGKIYITVLIYFVVISLTKSIVEEKELQLKETLNLLGVGSGLQWLAWYVQTFIIVFIGSAIITLCWKVILPQSEISFLPFSPWSLVLFVLVILGHCCICFSFLMSSLISTTRRVSLISILSVFATQYPEVILYSVGCSVGLNAFISLFLLSGLALLSYGVCNWDFYGVGLQWDNLFDIAWPGDTISVGHILLIMLLASFVSLLICLYMEQIRPGTYGVPRPWHFPCSCCCPTENLLPYKRLFYRCLGINRAAPDVERPEVDLIEADPEGKTAGVRIIGLSKTFGKMEAVKHISFDMFEDQITVLMGHNGAGKTTLISMLAGFIPPTSGTALVNGYDIQKERRQARRCIGLCPQQNVLFKHLSSASHIWFFSRLRGLRGAEVKAEVDKCLEQLNLKGKKKAAARNLSGGAQRRLSVACALCGGVKVLICDEPSTGLDPSARRELWKLILEAKEGCTILLTTHQLDDGEVLGDRMVIISDGQVRCIGSLPFLKKLVDASCLLTCETRKRCDVDKLTSLISLHVGSITPFSIKGRDVCYKLPLSKSNSFSSLFRDLELKKKELGIRGFGMSSVSLEEIFMSFGAEDLDYRKSGGADNKDDSYDDGEDQDENVQNCRSQWRAMMTKKWLSLYDNKVYFLLLMLIPIVYYLSTLISATDPHSLARVSMNVERYGDYGVTILVSDSGKSGEMRPAYYTISRMAGKDVELKVIRDPVEGYVKSALTTPEGRREIMFMPMAVELENPLVGWVGPRHFVHSAPMTLNLVYNVMAHELLGPKIRLKVTSAPYKEGRKANSLDVDGKAMRYQFYIVFYVCVAMILFANSIIQERDSHMKMQQEVSGLSMVTYWLSHLVFDMLVYLILALALLLAIYTYAPWYSLLTVLLFMGLTGLIFAYFLTLVLSSSLLAVSLIILFGNVLNPSGLYLAGQHYTKFEL